MVAHIYKGRGKNGGWVLLITTGAAINEGVLSERTYVSKVVAKQVAKDAGATPHNY
jgi:hypothetical protein